MSTKYKLAQWLTVSLALEREFVTHRQVASYQHAQISLSRHLSYKVQRFNVRARFILSLIFFRLGTLPSRWSGWRIFIAARHSIAFLLSQQFCDDFRCLCKNQTNNSPHTFDLINFVNITQNWCDNFPHLTPRLFDIRENLSSYVDCSTIVDWMRRAQKSPSYLPKCCGSLTSVSHSLYDVGK